MNFLRKKVYYSIISFIHLCIPKDAKLLKGITKVTEEWIKARAVSVRKMLCIITYLHVSSVQRILVTFGLSNMFITMVHIYTFLTKKYAN